MMEGTRPTLQVRLWRLFGGVSVRAKIIGIVLGSILLLSTFFVYEIVTVLPRVLEAYAFDHGVSIARDVAARATDPILINDQYSLHKLLNETRDNSSDVRYVFIVSPKGQVLAHTFGEGFPLELLGANVVAEGSNHQTVVIDAGTELVWDTAVPIFQGKAGTARVGISDVKLRGTVRSLTAQLGLVIIAIIAGSLLSGTILTWVLTRPILTLVDSTKKITQGDFSARVSKWAEDEIGELAEAFNEMAAELDRTNDLRAEREHLRRKLLEGVIAAQEEERGRIARELHDSTSQSLTSLILGLKNLGEMSEAKAHTVQLDILRDEAHNALNEVHSLALDLRPAVLDDLGLKAALERLVLVWEERNATPIDMFVQLDEDRLPGYIETALYRIVQEALTNVAKHSRAQSISVLLERRRDGVVAVIEDDGNGFEMSESTYHGRLGLLGMRERAELLGGSLTIESGPGKGTSIYVMVPL